MLRSCLPLLLTAGLAGADLSGQYAWSQVRTDGGGWVTGMVIHPTEAGLMYVRTDVGGAYRWDAAAGRWHQIMAAGRGLPAGVGGGVEAIAVSRLAPGTVLMAVDGGIMRSLDRGATWSVATGTTAIDMGPNSEYRWYGERLAVDPQNAQVVWFGSRAEGLWRSTDGGASFSKVAAVPVGLKERKSDGGESNGVAIGVSWVVIDGAGGTTAGRSSRIYAGVAGAGIWRSLDGGTTWAAMTGADAPSTGAIPSDAELAPDGTLWLTAKSNWWTSGASLVKADGGVWRWNPATATWTAFTPAGGAASYSEIAVDPTTPTRVIVSDQAFTTYVSTNAGTSWSYRSANSSTWSAPEAPWIGVTTAVDELWRKWSSPGALCFDPAVSGRLWYAEGFGVWSTDNATANPVVWTNRAQGIEEEVAFAAVHPPGGALVTATADLCGFHHDDGTALPPGGRILTQAFSTTTSLVYCQSTPTFMAAVSLNHHQHWPNFSGTSSDGGRTWTRFPSIANGTHPSALAYGTIAIAANNPQKMAWAPWNYGALHYTTDGGATWTKGVIAGTADTLWDLHYGSSWANSNAVVADGAAADTFYAYSRSYGDFYRSTDGGATWTLRSRNQGTLDWAEGEGGMVQVPGRAGHLWFAAAPHSQPYSWYGKGLWRSIDGAASWQEIAAVEDARMVAVGKAAPGASYPTIYAHAVVGGVEGIWRSIDQGATWDRLTMHAKPLGLLDSIRCIAGDWNTFGRVYVGFGGNGFAVGEAVVANQPPAISAIAASPATLVLP